MDNVTYKLEQMENEGMIEQMHHDWYAFRIKNSWARNMKALWQRWLMSTVKQIHEHNQQ